MPDSRKRRGPNPQDSKLFSENRLPALREAVHDFSWLLSRGYADKSALKLVGDRLKLTARQRIAVARCACGDAAHENRRSRQLSLEAIANRTVLIDGFNLLTTIEAALAGGVLIRGRDGCVRDMSSMHGNYRVLDDTAAALDLIFRTLRKLQVNRITWYLDKPVSNSGRLRGVIGEVARSFPEMKTDIRLVKDPDPLLARARGEIVVVTADSSILDRCESWINLAEAVISNLSDPVKVLDLAPDPETETFHP